MDKKLKLVMTDDVKLKGSVRKCTLIGKNITTVVLEQMTNPNVRELIV